MASGDRIGGGEFVSEGQEAEKGAEYEADGYGEDEMAGGTMPGEDSDHSPGGEDKAKAM